jgi:hypothetical protein
MGGLGILLVVIAIPVAISRPEEESAKEGNSGQVYTGRKGRSWRGARSTQEEIPTLRAAASATTLWW